MTIKTIIHNSTSNLQLTTRQLTTYGLQRLDPSWTRLYDAYREARSSLQRAIGEAKKRAWNKPVTNKQKLRPVGASL